ncbi:right-handed parallel beta-helix repeat-containing protein [Fibrella sp. HMF5335]|uniref:Right-handed parallel beta-helix repeat-containing protein n=1 Tax=Fibrella rubiginis TaxID=2817060 RepID=A0A939K8F8_9BACT|nr:PA14 domain-containing protein [Fibrella rubiginis]MBO0939685.1 right-handed parallel beta-helix repeat-containing protein [Fibrella rubiginis]
MKKRLLRYPHTLFGVFGLIGLLGNSLSATAQTTYYVASSGNDNNNGLSAAAPFQSLSKVNSLPLQAGDQVLFRRGDTFRGTLLLTRAGSAAQPVVFDAFGSGSKPVLAGSLPIGNWTSLGNNIWQASASVLGGQVTGVYSNGTALPLGRYPNLNAANRGYITIQSHMGNAQLTSRDALPGDFTGGEAVIRSTQWILDRAYITGQSGNTLTLNSSSTYNIADGFGFFVQNHPATLDQTGEWYYNPGNKTLRLYSESDPNTQVITATAFAEGIRVQNTSNITVRNVAVTQMLNTGVMIDNGSAITLSGVDVINAGENGVVMQGGGNTILIENGLFDGINNNGVSISGYQHVTFQGNTLRRVGLLPGRGKSGDGTYIGFITANTSDVTIDNNVVDQIGYNGINFTSGTVLRRNRVSNYCLTKSDGGGLYIWNGNRDSMSGVRIQNNIVFNGIGAPEGTPGGAYSGANGIFLDDCTTAVEVSDNTVFNCPGLGFFLHGSIGAQFMGNTSYNNGEAQFALNSRNGGCSPRDNLVQNNILVSKQVGQLVTKYESHLNDLTSYGQFDNNVYARPFDDKFDMRAVYNNGSYITGADLSLSEWQGRYGKDPNSTTSPVTYKPFSATATGVVKLNDTFGSTNDGWDAWSPNAHAIGVWDNTGRLDGGSLRVGFSASDPYVLASKGIGSVNQNQGYLLTFDAVASGNNKRVEVFLRQRNGSYRELDSRATVLVSGTRQHYELSYSANASEGDAVVIFQISDDGQTVWLDNVNMQEATRTAQNPDDFIRLEYNDTNSDKTILLGGTYRDGHNTLYTDQITLTPFTSAILFKYTANTPPPPPPVVLRDPENPANAVAGLDYSYYEGAWSQLPDFNALTPVKSGQTGQPDLSQRNREDNFGLRFTGYINVPTDGQYTFYTYSDDGSKLYIGSTPVVDNDGGHAEQERAGTIGLKAGKHAITIPYQQGGGGKALSVSYSGPGVGKQVIPAASFFRLNTPPPPPPTVTLRDPENPANTVGGLDYGYYEGNWTVLPNFGALTPIRSATAAVPDLNLARREDNFGLQFTGFINVPTDGVYTFFTNSDDGSKLLIGTTEVVNNDGGHGEQERAGTIGLKAGKHAITIPYFEWYAGQALSVSYSGPGVGKQVIPASAFFRLNTPPPPPPAVTLRDPENPATTVAGLDYGYFEGNWSQLPDFNSLTPVYSATTTAANLAVQHREDNFGLWFTGFINVPTDGVYTFYTSSDDGSKLYIGSTQVVNNDGGHAEQERSGTIGLKAGRHAISIPYFEGGGGQVLTVSYSGPGIGKQVIPASAFFRIPVIVTPPPVGTGTGLLGSYFNNKTLTAPSVLTRTDPTIDFDWGLGSPAPSVNVDNFSVRWSGQVEAPVTGSYFFTTTADDGVRLWVNNVLVIDNWNDHPPTSNTSGGLALVGGQKYSIRLEYYESGVGALARLQWSYGGQGQQLVPQSRLYPASSARLASIELNALPQPVVFPVPARSELQLRYYSATGGKATLQLTNVAAQPVLEATYDLVAGENLISMPVQNLMRGVYLLRLVDSNKRLTWKVVLSD